MDYIFASVNKIYFGYVENLNIRNTWLMMIMIIITVIMMIITMGKIMIEKILLKYNYSVINAIVLFKNQ